MKRYIVSEVRDWLVVHAQRLEAAGAKRRGRPKKNTDNNHINR